MEGAELLLAFDGDGTLWEGDVGVEIFEALLEVSGIRGAALEALASDARQIGLPIGDAEDGLRTVGPQESAYTHEESAHAHERAHSIARALHAAFLDGRYPDVQAYAMNAWAFAGWTEPEVEAFASDVLRRRRIEDRYRSGIRPILEWALRRGVDAYVVSASPKAMVIEAAGRIGFSRDRILAMTPAAPSGVLEPRIEGPVTYGEGKHKAIVAARPDAVLLGAFGDSAWDAAMLRAARVPVAVRPGAGLLAIAESIPGLVELAV